MKVFRRGFYKACKIGCRHGFAIPICCNCMEYNNWNGEDEYYLVTAMAAMEYIEKLEYYNLNIEVGEFEEQISKKIENMKIECPKRH